VVGVTVDLFEARGPANVFVRERVHTPDLFERLRYLVHHADGFVTLPGSIGTLTELYLTWTLLSVQGRPAAPLVVLGDMWRDVLDAHRHPALIPERLFTHVQIAETAADATRRVLALAEHP
jgi:predicted Rossmann-fold nucleotide-binding protein